MKYSLLLVSTLALSTLQAAVDPALLALVMPDAAAVAGVNVEQGKSSPFGRFLLSHVEADLLNDRMLAETGFDPTRDLREAVVATAGQNKTLALARGYFQPSRIIAAAARQGALTTNYKGIDMVALGKGPNGGTLAFLDSSTVAAGDLDSVKSAIDRRASNTSFSGDLAQRARNIAGTSDAWVVANAPSNLAAITGPETSQVRFLQNIKQLSGGVRLGSSAVSFTAEATTPSAQDAQSLADGLRFLVAMIPPDPAASNILDSARFSSEGPIARVSFDLPETEVEALIGPKGAKGNGPAKAPQIRRAR